MRATRERDQRCKEQNSKSLEQLSAGLSSVHVPKNSPKKKGSVPLDLKPGLSHCAVMSLDRVVQDFNVPLCLLARGSQNSSTLSGVCELFVQSLTPIPSPRPNPSGFFGESPMCLVVMCYLSVRMLSLFWWPSFTLELMCMCATVACSFNFSNTALQSFIKPSPALGC